MRVAFFLTIKGWWYDEIKLTNAMKESIYSHVKDIKNKSKLRIDYAVGYYLQHLYKDTNHVMIDLIKPEDIIKTKKFKIKQYDLVIAQWLSPLAVFQTYKNVAGKAYNDMLLKHQTKVYPPPKYTNFIEDKCAYSALLRSKQIPSPKDFCVSKTMYDKSKNKDAFVQTIVQKIQSKNINNNNQVFVKPILGTGSWGTKVLNPTKKSDWKRYMKTTFEKKKYPKVLIQNFFPDFGTTHMEIRFVFIGPHLSHTAANDSTGKWFRPTQEGGKLKLPEYATLKKYSETILNTILKPMFFGNLPMLETRIDFGCCLNGQKGKYWVNEIEYAGGVLSFMDKKTQFDLHTKFTKQLVHVIEYKRKNK